MRYQTQDSQDLNLMGGNRNREESIFKDNQKHKLSFEMLCANFVHLVTTLDEDALLGFHPSSLTLSMINFGFIQIKSTSYKLLTHGLII